MKRRLHLLSCLCHTINPGLSQIQCNRLENDYASISPDELSWLVALADRALLLPAWHIGLTRKNLDQQLARNLREALEAAWRLNRVRNQALRADAKTVSEALAEIDCRTVYLKGVGHILADTYRDGGARMTTDIDVLVPAERLQDAARHLLAKGFSPVHGQLALRKRKKWSHHLDGLTRHDMTTGVELHDAFLADHPDWPSMSSILARSEPVPDLPRARTPETRHAAQIAIAHSTLRYRHIAQEYLHLRDMADLLFLMEYRALDIVALRRDFQRAGHVAALGWFVAAADQLFGSDLGGADALTTLSDRNRASRELEHWLARRAPRSGSVVDWVRLRFQNLHSALTRRSHRDHLKALVLDPIYRKAHRQRRRGDLL